MAGVCGGSGSSSCAGAACAGLAAVAGLRVAFAAARGGAAGLVFFRAGARVRAVRVRVVLPGGSGGFSGWAVPGAGGEVTGRGLLAGGLSLRGGCCR